MNRIINVVIICVFLAPGVVSAQETKPSKPPIRIALRAGLFSSQFAFSNLPYDQEKPTGDDALYGGVQVDIPLSPKVSIVPELVYAMSSVQSLIDGSVILADDFTHLFVPLLFKYRLGKVSVLAGGQAEFLTSVSAAYVGTDGNGNPDFMRAGMNDPTYKKLRFSGVFGAEWVFKHRFGIDARYQVGLTDFKDKNTIAEIPKLIDKIKAHGLQVGLFYRFGKKPAKA